VRLAICYGKGEDGSVPDKEEVTRADGMVGTGGCTAAAVTDGCTAAAKDGYHDGYTESWIA